MAKFVKSDRDIPDINVELDKVTTEKKVKSKKEKKNKKDNGSKKGLFKGLRSEIGRVSWPNKKNMVKYSIATISFIVFFSAFFYVIELIMALLEAGV